MVTHTAQSGRIKYGVKHFTVDTLKELKGIKIYNIEMGSTALVIENGTTYILNSDYKWVALPKASGSGSSSNNNPSTNPEVDDFDLATKEDIDDLFGDQDSDDLNLATKEDIDNMF